MVDALEETLGRFQNCLIQLCTWNCTEYRFKSCPDYKKIKK